MRLFADILLILLSIGYAGRQVNDLSVNSVISRSIETISGKEEPSAVTFAHITDLHVNPQSESEVSLNRIVDEINNTVLDFTLVTGDLTNAGSDAEMGAVKKALDRLKKPCYVIPGNHETNWSESAGLTFNKLWGDDRFIFRHNEFLFVGFNTGPFMRMGDGHVRKEDLIWLRKELGEKKKESDILVAVSHYPLADGLDDWFTVTDILKSFDCSLSFCGHGHRLSLLNFDGIPGIMGRAVVTSGSTAPGYNIVKVENGNVRVYNKEVQKDISDPEIQINYLNRDELNGLAVSPKPDYSVNKEYEKVISITQISDSSSVFTGPCLFNDSLLAYGNSSGALKVLIKHNFKKLWEIKTAGPIYSNPVTAKGVVMIGTVDGSIIGFEGTTGRELWRINTGRPVLAEGITEKGYLYIGAGDRSFYKIDVLSGKVSWQFDSVGGLIQGKPALSGSEVIFGAWDRHLYCLDKNDGSLKWKWNNGKPQELYSPGNIIPVCSDGKVFIVAPDRYMTAIDISTGKEIWRTGRHKVRESMGISEDGSVIYAKLMNDTLIAVSAKGSVPVTMWAESLGFGYEHNPCPVAAYGNNAVIGTRSGVLIAFDSKTKEILWKYKAGNSSVNRIISDEKGNLWFTLIEGKIGTIASINNKYNM